MIYLQGWQMLFYAFCLVTLIQLFYYLYYYLRLAIHKRQSRESVQTHPVSVIICARDEAANLAKNLPGSLMQQYTTTHEVIVVNDNSFDESKYILQEFQRQYKQLRIVELTQEAKMIPGKKFPLSIGIKSARHEIVLLTDADCVPATEFWIDKMQQCYAEGTEIVLGYGAYHKRKGLLNKLIRWDTFHAALQYLSYALAGQTYMGVGRNLSYRKTVFFRHKGFSAHNHVSSGDDDLFINMAATGKNVVISTDPDTFTLSNPSRSFGEWFRQKNRHLSTARYYRPLHKVLLGMYTGSHFLFYPLLAASCLLYRWDFALVVYGIRLIVQLAVLYPVLRKLKEADLFPLLPLLDIWMFFYYLIFSSGVFGKPVKNWK
jgi:cellulose synthase/poly-beta-1,6-N-acetylglucosamine synthase-like glycosyltransferase